MSMVERVGGARQTGASQRGQPPTGVHTSTHEYRLRGAETRFFGRKAELETLYNALRDAATGNCLQVVSISGPTGTGKRRLIDETLKLVDVNKRGIGLFMTGSMPDESDNSLRFTDQLLRQRFHLVGGSVDELHAQLNQGLVGMVGESRRPDAVKLLAHLLSLPVT
ncbi:MAG: hypothetical protein ACI9OJ_004121, partial [Myxococcota bacterium]